MAQDGGLQNFRVQYEEGGDLPVFVDHLHAQTVEHGIYLAMATRLPPREKRTAQASVQATLYLPVQAIGALHALAEGYWRHVGEPEIQFSKEPVELRHDLPRADIPVLGDYFSCKQASGGVQLSVGRQSAASPDAVSVYATYLMNPRTMLELHFLTHTLVGLIKVPEHAGKPAQVQTH